MENFLSLNLSLIEDMKIKIILGSNRKNSKTALYMRKFLAEAKKQDITITQDIKKADGLFIFTPTHWFSAPWRLKKYIDTELYKSEEYYNYNYEGKLFGAFVYSPEGGESLVLSQLGITANIMGFIIPPFSLIYYRNNKEDRWALNFKYLLASWKKLSLTPLIDKPNV